MSVKLPSFFTRALQRNGKNNNNLPKKTNHILISSIHPFITSENVSTILNANYTTQKRHKTSQNALASNLVVVPFVVASLACFTTRTILLHSKVKQQT
jgi:hypothetical protein